MLPYSTPPSGGGLTDDTRRKIREARARQAFSEETRAKMSAGLKVSWAKRKAARGET